MITTWGAGITAAAGTGLAHPLFLELLTLHKSNPNGLHEGFPYHTCVHCRGFVTAAPRRAGTLISVFLSGLGLSSPLQIFALVVLYTTNKLICRQLILKRRNFQRKRLPASIFYGVLQSVSRFYPPLQGRLLTCY